jgi:phosphatidylinositol-3-phosphatase
MRPRPGVWLPITLIVIAACGGTSRQNPPGGGGGGSPPTFTADHVALVVLENHSAAEVLGNAAMPYFNSLVMQHSVAMNYFANTHPSIGNYFMLTTGQIMSNDDNFAGIISDDNIARALTGAGKTWKAYMESLPVQGYTGGDVNPYVKHHNPFTYFSDVLSSSAQAANLVPFSQLAADMGANTLPSFAYIIPNVQNDAHDCPGGAPTCADSAKLAAADGWLKTNIDPLIHSPAFANGVLIITFDEGDPTDMANGGGQVATVLVGAKVKAGFQSVTFYQHQSTLRLILDLLKVSDHPGAAATATAMGEFFQ